MRTDVSGASLLYVASGGTGKTTSSRKLGRRFGDVTDETGGSSTRGPSPLPQASVGATARLGLKQEVARDGLELLSATTAPQVAGIVVLVRDPESAVVDVEDVKDMDAVSTLVPQTSSLWQLD
ncbi:MAG: hypothetical protein ABIQ61_02700 [Ornithinibacter sp.]